MGRKFIPGLVISSLCCFHSQLCGQTSNETPSFFHSFSRNGVAAWAAGGAYVAGPAKPFAGLHNPATLGATRFDFYVEGGKRFKANYPIFVEFNDQYIAPAVALLSKGFGEWVVSAGYENYYEARYETKIEESPEPFPDGTGSFIDIESQSKVHAFFSSAKYAFGSRAAVGVTVGLNYLKVNEKAGIFGSEGDGLGFQAVVGGIVNASENVTLGASFRFASDIDFEQQFNEDVVDSLTNERGETFVALPSEQTLTFPWSAQIGLGYQPLPQLRLLAMLDYQHWSSFGSGADNLTNIHVGMELSLNRSSISVGFFTSENPAEVFGDAIDQNFLTAGVDMPVVGGLRVSAMILDGHLLSNDDSEFHQTYFAGGLRYSIQ